MFARKGRVNVPFVILGSAVKLTAKKGIFMHCKPQVSPVNPNDTANLPFTE